MDFLWSVYGYVFKKKNQLWATKTAEAGSSQGQDHSELRNRAPFQSKKILKEEEIGGAVLQESICLVFNGLEFHL